jgi:hypothetical protein
VNGIEGLPIDAPFTAMSHTTFLPDDDGGEDEAPLPAGE